MHFFGLKQLIKVPKWITSSSSTIIDQVLVSYPVRVTLQGVMDTGFSDHQLIYCTRKLFRTKRGSKLNFPNYQNYNDSNEAYNDFIQKIMEVIDKVALIKERRIKQNSQEWFDWGFADETKIRDKLFKKFKKSKLHIDKDIYNAPRHKL